MDTHIHKKLALAKKCCYK